LTRRAKHRHNGIIETSLSGPRGNHPLRAFSFRFQESDGVPRIAASPSLKRVHGAPTRAPPSEPHLLAEHARTCRPAVRAFACAAAVPGDGDKLLVWDKVLGLGSTDPLAGFAAITANLVVSFYFAKRGFENVARIIKR
jgi:hypothetical protein